MKILLDEQIHTAFKEALQTHANVFSIKDKHWKGLSNGTLREKLNEENFDFFLTSDKNIPFQQNIKKMNFTIILIDTPSLRAAKQALFAPIIQDLLENLPDTLPKMFHISIPEFNNMMFVEKLKIRFTSDEIFFV